MRICKRGCAWLWELRVAVGAALCRDKELEYEDLFQGAETVDIAFLTDLINLLFAGKDTVSGIYQALEKIGKYLEGDSVNVMELTSDKKHFEETHRWESAPMRVLNCNFREIPAIFVQCQTYVFNESGLYVCNHISELQKQNRMTAERERIRGTKSMMQVMLKERMTFLMACRILTVAIYKESSMQYTRKVIYSDLLTKSWNVKRFLSEVDRKENKNGWKGAIVTFDIKHFKLVNTKCGYQTGNSVLIEVSNVLRIFMDEDECFARQEADTFILFLYYQDIKNLKERLKHLLQHIEHLPAKFNIDFPFYCMAGVYLVQKGETDFEEMIECANLARKSVKTYHKSEFSIFEPDTKKARYQEGYLSSLMQQALENEEFCVYFQPKVNVKKGTYAGLEALVRWIAADGRMIMPGDFIPLFERNGFISELDFYVFEQVCREMSRWRSICPVFISRRDTFWNGFICCAEVMRYLKI